jgi:hypothetical protein
LLNVKLNLTAIAVTETWLNLSTAGAYVIPGYNFIAKSRTIKGSGGVGFFVDASINCTIREDMCRLLP